MNSKGISHMYQLSEFKKKRSHVNAVCSSGLPPRTFTLTLAKSWYMSILPTENCLLA